MTEEEKEAFIAKQEIEDIWKNAGAGGNKNWLMASIAHSLIRIARSQERLVALSEMDLETALEAEIENRSKIKADEIVAESTKRSFLGKKT